MYRAGLESMLGLRRQGDTFSIDPCIPSSWPDYEITWRVKSTRYLISVSNPGRQCRGVLSALLDDAPVDAAAIPLVDDGRTHLVSVVLGTSPSPAIETPRLEYAGTAGSPSRPPLRAGV
jgi:cyclic beta-1,2-glucan synthetase